MPSWRPFSGPQVTTGGYSFLCMACDYVRASTCFLWQTQLIFPSVYISALEENSLKKAKKVVYPLFPSIWQDWMSPLVFSLQWGVISAGFNSSLTCIISSSLVEMRGLESLFAKWSSPAWVTAQNPSFESQRWNQTITGQWKICIGIWVRAVSPNPHGNCHYSCGICSLTPTVLHEQRKPPAFGGAEVFHCYYGTFQHGNNR